MKNWSLALAVVVGVFGAGIPTASVRAQVAEAQPADLAQRVVDGLSLDERYQDFVGDFVQHGLNDGSASPATPSTKLQDKVRAYLLANRAEAEAVLRQKLVERYSATELQQVLSLQSIGQPLEDVMPQVAYALHAAVASALADISRPLTTNRE